MDETKKAKITRFLDDRIMSDSVRDVIFNSFLKPKPLCDVNLLAASRLAIDLLQEAWHDLERFRDNKENEKKPLKQIGL